jgi:hypothetical protein
MESSHYRDKIAKKILPESKPTFANIRDNTLFNTPKQIQIYCKKKREKITKQIYYKKTNQIKLRHVSHSFPLFLFSIGRKNSSPLSSMYFNSKFKPYHCNNSTLLLGLNPTIIHNLSCYIV